jgi:hypothetical protein
MKTHLARAAANFSTSLVEEHLMDIEITGSGTNIDSYTENSS